MSVLHHEEEEAADAASLWLAAIDITAAVVLSPIVPVAAVNASRAELWSSTCCSSAGASSVPKAPPAPSAAPSAERTAPAAPAPVSASASASASLSPSARAPFLVLLRERFASGPGGLLARTRHFRFLQLCQQGGR